MLSLSLSRRVKNAIKYLLFAVALENPKTANSNLFKFYSYLCWWKIMCSWCVFCGINIFIEIYVVHCIKRAFFISMLPLPLLWKRFSFSRVTSSCKRHAVKRESMNESKIWTRFQSNCDNYGISWKIYWTPEVKRSL